MDDEETEISRILGKLGLMQPAGGILGGQYPPPAPPSALQSPPFVPGLPSGPDAPGGNDAIDLARALQAIDNHSAALMALNRTGAAPGASSATSDSAPDQGSLPAPGNAMALAAARQRPAPSRRPLPWPGFTPHFLDFASPDTQPAWLPNGGTPSGDALVNERFSAQKDLDQSALIPNTVAAPSRVLPQINFPNLQKYGIDPDDLMNRIVRAESDGNPTARNPVSSATGLSQFTKGTWPEVIKHYRPDLYAWFLHQPRQALLELRMDPDLARQMAPAYADQNAGELENNQLPVTPTNLYLAHHFGATGATRLLTADPGALAKTVLSPGAIRDNSKFIDPDTTTAGDVISEIAYRMEHGHGRPQPRPPRR